MKTLEYNSRFAWVNWLLNKWPFCLDTDSITPVLEIEYGANPLTSGKPDFRNLHIRIGRACSMRSLFRNGLLYIRILRPFGVFVHLRWCGGCRWAFLQAGIGWKLNGRFAVIRRVQSDESAAAGVSGRNFGQAHGWLTGEH